MKKLYNTLRRAGLNFHLILLAAISVVFISLNTESESNTNTRVISPEWNQFPTVAMDDAPVQGVPKDFGPGITMTIDEIMQKEAMLPADRYFKPKPKEIKENEEDKEALENMQQNPDAPSISKWPPQNEDQKKQEPSQTDNPQTVGTSFLGPQVSTSGYIPPDSQGDVGPTQVLACANGRITVYSKAGVVGGLNADLDVFFSSVDNGTGTSDPHIRYDRLTSRWYVVGINLPASGANRIMIARSSGPTITNTSSFTFFQFQQDAVGTPGGDLSGFADYPTLGVDKFALYIGCNMFNPGYIGTSVWVINKANLNAGSLTVTGFHEISTSMTEGPRTPQGVDNDDPSATEGYFVGVSNFFYGRVTIRRVTNPGGAPALSGNLNITVPATNAPILVRHLGAAANRRLDALEDRLFAAEIHKNKITGSITLWTAHNIEVNTSGVGTVGGGRNGSRWYEITNLTTSPSLVQSGTVFSNVATASGPDNFWIPSCVMSGQGHMALAMSVAGVNRRAEISVTGRLRTDALGTTQANTTAQTSTTSYNIEAVDGQRWGDYSQTVVDPNDDMTMWTFQEYCNANNSWGVRAIQLRAPLPATPSSSSLTNIATGQASVNITITGTSVAGSEFFDPGPDAGGPGYANHISASISGGVTVNSITFNSPTSVTLNISTVGSPLGLKNITVTNPDGQQSTGNNLINIISSSVTLNLTAYLEGFYNSSTDLMVRDTVRAYLRNSSSPYALVDSGKVYLSTTGTGSISYNNAADGINYFIQMKHRNALETWSQSPGQSFSGGILNYDFTTDSTKAYGNNETLVDNGPNKFAFYEGDVNHNGVVALSDIIQTYNDAGIFLTGYIISDLNGDNIVNLNDVIIAYNNASRFVVLLSP